MAEPWTLRVALAYPASLAVPCAGLVVLALSWPAQATAGRGLVYVLVGLAGVALCVGRNVEISLEGGFGDRQNVELTGTYRF